MHCYLNSFIIMKIWKPWRRLKFWKNGNLIVHIVFNRYRKSLPTLAGLCSKARFVKAKTPESGIRFVHWIVAVYKELPCCGCGGYRSGIVCIIPGVEQEVGLEPVASISELPAHLEQLVLHTRSSWSCTLRAAGPALVLQHHQHNSFPALPRI